MPRDNRKGADLDQTISRLEWESPPGRVRYDWDAISAQLRTHPMQWARIFERDRTSLVNAIRQGGIAVLDPALGFEVRTTNNTRTNPRTCTLYLRYNPNGNEKKGRK